MSIMLFKKAVKATEVQTAPLLCEGTYAAVVHTVMVKTKEGTTEPVAVTVNFALNGHEQNIERDYPPKIEGRSPLLRDSKILLGRPLTRDEEADGFDPGILAGRSCQVVLVHRRDTSGRLKAQAGMVLAPSVTAVSPPALVATT